MTPAVARVEWRPCWRIISSRFPPIGLFDRVTDPADLDEIIELESLTNPRLRDEVGEIRLVAPQDRITGPNSSIIMAAFTHRNPQGSRFTDGSYGVFYAASDLQTAIAETKYHRERFLRATSEDHTEIDMRVYAVDLDGQLHDLRGQKQSYPLVYQSDDYGASQGLAKTLRESGSNGIAYDSLRRDGGSCAAVFRPPLLSNVRQERHLSYVWDGRKIANVYEKRTLET
ncbi:MAG: RES family NAD+ phosphorylase [Rhodospirillaceae bacterium]|nr:RES family NAD+ phosphorylase [Rhodospirillaceae bacterium]